jgi:AP-4 complex subunit epsilon-1
VDVWSALCALTKVINAETIPAVVGHVAGLLSHSKYLTVRAFLIVYRPLIRKKAVAALHRFWETSPVSIEPYQDKFRIVLCDSDPSVMSAALCLFYDLIQVCDARS